MEIVQLHIGELSPIRQRCIASVKAFYPDWLYTFHTSADDVMKEIMEKYGIEDYPKEWTGPHRWHGGIVAVSDWFRFYLLSLPGDRVWIDTDLEIIKRFDFDLAGKPYFNYVNKNKKIDYSFIYNNGCQVAFDAVLRRRVKEKHFGWMVHEPEHIEHYPIPIEYFKHYGSSEYFDASK
jgi:hypothetical protein